MELQGHDAASPKAKTGFQIYRQPIENISRERLERYFIQLSCEHAELEEQLANRRAAIERVIAVATDDILDALRDPPR